MSVNGVAIRDGSVISDAGDLKITADDAYQLVVDGVAWVPVSSSYDGDNYVISSGGRFVIFMDGKVVFSFMNDYQADFERRGANCRLFDINDTQVASQDVQDGRYVQLGCPDTAHHGTVILRAESSVTSQQMIDFGITSSNGDITVQSTGSSYVTCNLENFDPLQPIIVRCGNVLFCFVYPV